MAKRKKEGGAKTPGVKRPIWYRMTRFFDEPGQRVAEVQGHDVICQGRIYEGVLKCGCGAEHDLEQLLVRGDPRVELEGQGEGATVRLMPTLAVCQVPVDSLGGLMAEKLQATLIANLRCAALILTNNVQLAQFKEISNSMAERIMAGADAEKAPDRKNGGEVIQIGSGKKEGDAQGGERRPTV